MSSCSCRSSLSTNGRPELTKEKLTDEIQKEFEDEMPGIGFNFSQYIQDNVEEALSGVKGANSIKIVGPNLTKLEELADQVLAEVQQVRGVEDLGIFHVMGQPNLNIKVDRAKAARYGLNSGDVNTVIQAAMGGAVATTVLEGDRQFGLQVRLLPEFRSSIDAIRNVKVGYATSGGVNAYIPLSELATISLDTGASFIYRDRSQRYVPIKFSVRGRDLGGTVAEAQERVAKKIKLPTGYQILWSGEFENLQNAKTRLLIVVPVTLPADSAPAVRLVQLAARQSRVRGGHSLRHRRRPRSRSISPGSISACRRRSASSRCSASRSWTAF